MSTITRSRSRVKASSQPLDVRLQITIRGTNYSVTRFDPGPDNTKAYRLEKVGGKGEVYDLARTNEGLIICDCPSYVDTHEGTSSTCKHGTALVEVGLLEPVAYVAAAPVEAPAPIAEARPRPAPFDAEIYRAQNAVAEGRALWLEHRHLFATEPPPAEAPCCPAAEPAPCSACVTPAPIAEPTTAIVDGPHAEPTEDLEPPEWPFADWIEHQAKMFGKFRTPRGTWLAAQIARLAKQARFLDAKDPADYDDRSNIFGMLDGLDDDDQVEAEDLDAAWRDPVEYAW